MPGFNPCTGFFVPPPGIRMAGMVQSVRGVSRTGFAR
ncbi:hypothetical protein HNR55_001674 [Acetobacter lovaniensis]|uniref:Uncharacterized protein n=1 Tax=Acetobacter lovaniensis TaxID=104100 RepID=A0A841QF61_9PROT|nr:hypothetical protein [Acetobacter lovaniensis]